MAETESTNLTRLYRIGTSLISARTLHDVFQNAVLGLSKSLQARAAILWLFSGKDGVLVPTQSYMEEKLALRNIALGADYLGEAYRTGKPMLLTSATFAQPVKHVQLNKAALPETGLCYPFKTKTDLTGVLELIGRENGTAFTEEDVEFTGKALELVLTAAGNAKFYEDQEKNQLHAITRLALLYDIGQIFNSTLELNQLLPIICGKVREILEAGTCTIWFLNSNGESFFCGKSKGEDEEVFNDFKAKLEDDFVGEVISGNEGMLLEDASTEERFQKRFPEAGEPQVLTYIASPLECQGQMLGALELINRTTEEPYNEEDLFLLNDLAKQAAISIHNANLLQAERKAKELDSLLQISREITSTLNLDRVLLTLVNQSATIISYDRAAIALVEGTKVELAAVSGRMEVDKKSDEMRDLQDLLTWASRLEKGLYVSEFEGNIITDREEVREKFKDYFARTGYQSFVALPLRDEEGDLGILAFESTAPYFLDERNLEVVNILGNQATVAIRNAQLYRRVPLINIMEPLMQRKARLMKMPRERRMVWGGIALAVLLALVLVPWNLKIAGDATVLPALRTPVAAEVEGIVQSVPVREGALLKAGDRIATLYDQDYRLALENQQARRDVLLKQIARSDSTGDFTTSRLLRIQLDQTLREIQFDEEQLKRTVLIAPINGTLVTPKIEEKVGAFLRKGEDFCELADMRAPRAEIQVQEDDLSYVKLGQPVRLKMNAYPTVSFFGKVMHLGTQVTGTSPNRTFTIQTQIENQDQLLKSGMVGRAKVEAGYHSIGYVLLRKPVRFLWNKLWTWLP
jgi:GAF domain-containing protein